MTAPQPTPQQVRELAAHAHCDPRTVRAYYAGRAVRPTLAERIDAACRARRVPPPTTRPQ